MSWHDPGSRWSRGIRRRALLKAFGAVICAVFTIGWLVNGAVSIGSGSQCSASISMATFVFGVLVLLLSVVGFGGAVILGSQAVTTSSLRRRLPERDGCACPFCWHDMQRDQDGADARCSRCGVELPHAALRDYWGQYGLDAYSADRFLKSIDPRGRHQRTGRLSWSAGYTGRRWAALLPLLLALLLVLFLPTYEVTFRGGSLLVGVVNFLPMTAILAGMVMVIMGMKMYVGTSRHCAVCGYTQPPQHVPNRCSECGADLTNPGSTTIGAVKRRPTMLVAGFAFVALGIVLSFTHASIDRSAAAIMATDSLLRAIVSQSRGSTTHQWQELATRSLTPEQSARLFDGLTNKLISHGYLSREATKWIDAHLFGHGHEIPKEIIERYLENLVFLELTAPQQVQIGESFSVTVDAMRRVTVFSQFRPTVVFGGFYVDDDKQPRERADLSILAWRLYSPHRLLDTMRDDPRPRLTLTPDSAGEIRVRCSVWKVIVAGHDRFTVQWRDNGTPVIPPSAIWHRRIDLEAIITVTE